MKETYTFVITLVLLFSLALTFQFATPTIVRSNANGAALTGRTGSDRSAYSAETAAVHGHAPATSFPIRIGLTPQPISIPGCSNPRDLGDVSGGQWVEVGNVGWPHAPSTICVALSISSSLSELNSSYVDLVLAGNSPWRWNEGGGWISVDIYDASSGAWTGASGYAGWASPLWNRDLTLHNVPLQRELLMRVISRSSLNLDLAMRPEFREATSTSISSMLVHKVSGRTGASFTLCEQAKKFPHEKVLIGTVSIREAAVAAYLTQ